MFYCFSCLFFGATPGLDAGGCVKVVLTAGMTAILPAGMIHLVQTVGESVVVGANFLHSAHRGKIIETAREEILQDVHKAGFYHLPNFKISNMI